MSKKTLSRTNNAIPFKRRQVDPPRLQTVGASVNETEQSTIYTALKRAGFKSASEGAREVLLAWATDQPLPVKNAA